MLFYFMDDDRDFIWHGRKFSEGMIIEATPFYNIDRLQVYLLTPKTNCKQISGQKVQSENAMEKNCWGSVSDDNGHIGCLLHCRLRYKRLFFPKTAFSFHSRDRFIPFTDVS